MRTVLWSFLNYRMRIVCLILELINHFFDNVYRIIKLFFFINVNYQVTWPVFLSVRMVHLTCSLWSFVPRVVLILISYSLVLDFKHLTNLAVALVQVLPGSWNWPRIWMHAALSIWDILIWILNNAYWWSWSLFYIFGLFIYLSESFQRIFSYFFQKAAFLIWWWLLFKIHYCMLCQFRCFWFILWLNFRFVLLLKDVEWLSNQIICIGLVDDGTMRWNYLVILNCLICLLFCSFFLSSRFLSIWGRLFV